MPQLPDAWPESRPVPAVDREVSEESPAPVGQRASDSAEPPPSIRDTEPDRPDTLRLNKAVMRTVEQWVQVRGKRKKPVIAAALREYMACHGVAS